MDPKWKPGVWNKAADGSSMKVTNTPEKLKMERISPGKAHSHDIVKIDKVTGRVLQIGVGPNTVRKSSGPAAAKLPSFTPLAPKPGTTPGKPNPGAKFGTVQGKGAMPRGPGFGPKNK